MLSFSADKVTTGTCSFVSFILNVAPVGLLIPSTGGLFPCEATTGGLFPCEATAPQYALLLNTQFSNQVKVNGISSVLQKLLRYFNETAVLTASFSTLPPSNFPVILVL